MSGFIAASRWAGSKPGYVFQKSIQGLGYYPDWRLVKGEDNVGVKRQFKETTDDVVGGMGQASKRIANDRSVEQSNEGGKEGDEGDGSAAEVEALDASGLKQILISFEKKINRNQEMRMKHPNDPTKFMQSEIELNDEINTLLAIAASPELYPLFVSLGAMRSVLGVLTHENTDVSLSAVSLLQEMTDPDTLLTLIEGNQIAMCLLDSFIKEQGLELIVQNLSRLDESQDEDAMGVSHTLTIIENIIEVRPQLAEDIVSRTNIIEYLLTRIGQQIYDANKLHASEILAILLQNSITNQEVISTIKITSQSSTSTGLEHMLQIIFYLRKVTPSSPGEIEFIENVFLSLRSSLLIEANRQQFLAAEGFELMIKSLKQDTYIASCIIKTLSYAVKGSLDSCIKLIDIGGLKYIFPLFMGKAILKNSTKKRGFREEQEEYAISILSELCSQLVLADTTHKDILQRLIAKFHESISERVQRFEVLFDKYTKEINRTEAELVLLRQDLEEDGDEEALEEFDSESNIYSRLFNGGLFSLQQVCKIIAFACIFDIGTAKTVSEYIVQKVLEVLREAAVHITDEDTADSVDVALNKKSLVTLSAALSKVVGSI